jgi:hypothetical protein
MKTIKLFVIFAIFTAFSFQAASANEWESIELINRLLSLTVPGAPVIHEDYVIFTADSSIRRVGVAFAHEFFENTYWFTPLFIPQDNRNPVILPGEKVPSPHMDSGIQFVVYKVPDHLRELEYRLVINGLWTTDPVNPLTLRDHNSGLTFSVLRLPPRTTRPNPLNGLPEGLHFTFRGPPGETITVEIGRAHV